jgi:putative membrane protein
MIDDHTRSGEAPRRAAMASGLPAPPAAMSGDQAALLSSLQSLRGTDFDRAYARQQVLAHTQALDVERSFATAGNDPNLRAVAGSAVPMIRQHLEMAERLRAAVGGS